LEGPIRIRDCPKDTFNPTLKAKINNKPLKGAKLRLAPLLQLFRAEEARKQKMVAVFLIQ
jgi:hypothetical protein